MLLPGRNPGEEKQGWEAQWGNLTEPFFFQILVKNHRSSLKKKTTKGKEEKKKKNPEAVPGKSDMICVEKRGKGPS